ncbi:MAG: calcium/sodium antiporter [Pseudomonadales bacterium]|nr:calcium/sodium antiporter [Pseudomonadales bacterium]MCP5183048.1 calcium/sodium antiporter [Pseudomonadales bacterium]
MSDVLLLLTGLAMLYFGGEWLVKGGSLLATRLGVPPLVIGVTVMAIGTSAPELVVCVHAALAGENDIALGNVVGSNISNIGLILGIALVMRPIISSPSVARVHAPVMLVITGVVLLMMWGNGLGHVDGLFLLVGLALYVGYCFRECLREPEEHEVFEIEAPAGRGMGYFLLLLGAGLGLLLLGAHVLVESAVDIARVAGVSEAFIGITIVAVGTSLPELTTTVVATLRNEGDLAIGNVVGSNIFNLLLILGTTAVIEPLVMGGVHWTDLAAVFLISAILVVLLHRRGRLARGSGMLLLGSYISYMIWLTATA